MRDHCRCGVSLELFRGLVIMMSIWDSSATRIYYKVALRTSGRCKGDIADKIGPILVLKRCFFLCQDGSSGKPEEGTGTEKKRWARISVSSYLPTIFISHLDGINKLSLGDAGMGPGTQIA